MPIVVLVALVVLAGIGTGLFLGLGDGVRGPVEGGLPAASAIDGDGIQVKTRDVEVTLGFPGASPSDPLRVASALEEVDVHGMEAKLAAARGSGLVVAASGEVPVLLGFLDSDSDALQLDARSTAEALVLLTPSVNSHLPAWHDMALSALRAHEGYQDYVAVVTSTLARDPASLLSTENEEIWEPLAELSNATGAALAELSVAEAPSPVALASTSPYLISTAPPDHPYEAWVFSTCWLLVEPVVDTMSFKTTNQIPVAFEGSIKDAKGNTLKVPWPGGLELNCQVILPRNHYSKTCPETTFLLPQAGDYTVTYSPTGNCALAWDVYSFAMDALGVILGVNLSEKLPLNVDPQRLQGLLQVKAAAKLVAAIQAGDAAGFFTGTMAFLKDPAVQGYLGEEVKDLCSTLFNEGSMGLLGMTLSKFMTIVSGTKFAFDTGARFAAYIQVAEQEEKYGSQAWVVELSTTSTTEPVVTTSTTAAVWEEVLGNLMTPPPLTSTRSEENERAEKMATLVVDEKHAGVGKNTLSFILRWCLVNEAATGRIEQGTVFHGLIEITNNGPKSEYITPGWMEQRFVAIDSDGSIFPCYIIDCFSQPMDSYMSHYIDVGNYERENIGVTVGYDGAKVVAIVHVTNGTPDAGWRVGEK